MPLTTAVVQITLDTSGQTLRLTWSEAPGATPRSVPDADTTRLHALANQVGEAEKSLAYANNPAPGARLALGRALYELLDGPERALTQRLSQARSTGAPCHLIVRLHAEDHDRLSQHPAAHWRWELLADEQGHVCTREHVSLAVQLGEQAGGAPKVLEHGVLRVLFMAYSPADTDPELDYEGEEDRIQEALADFIADGRATVHVAEEGTVAELERRLKLEDYDVVHLSGHGMLRGGKPYLVMEDEEGHADLVSPDRLWAALKRARTLPRLLMIASCHSADARGDMPSLAAQLVAWGTPAVVGWVRPVRDDVATLAARDLYERLCTGIGSTEAVAFCRRELYAADQGTQHPSLAWGTLHLVTRDPMGFQLHPEAQPSRVTDTPIPDEMYRFLDQQGQMKVLQRGFVGRRRELQRLVRILRHGKEGETPRAGAYILGMKGVGKSCLAGRALDRHIQDVGEVGLVVVHGELMDHRILEQFRLLAVQWRDATAQAILQQPDASVAQRLEQVLRGPWARRRVVMVFDDFEQNVELRPDGQARLSLAAAQLLGVVLPACRVGRPKLLLTTTASFDPPTGEAEALAPIELGPFQPASVRKLWSRGQAEQGDLHQVPLAQWMELAKRLGHNARILDWARQLMSGKTPADVQRVVEEAQEQLPDWRHGAADVEAQEQLARLFLHHMAFAEACRSVSPDSVTFVKRARVFEAPVPAVAYREIAAGLDIDLARHLPALANRGLLEVGRVGGDRAYRVSPLVEPALDVENPERWHAIAAAYWAEALQTAAGRSFVNVHMGWEHALLAREENLADAFAKRIDSTLYQQGLYGQNQGLALRHIQCFPESVWANQWAGEAEWRAGNLKNGQHYFARAEALGQQNGIDDRSLSVLLHYFSGLLQAQGDLPGARRRLERALEIQAVLYSTEADSDIASLLDALASVLRAQGDFAGARRHLERSLEIKAVVYGTEAHPNVAASLHNLGGVLRSQGDLAGARRHLERSLEIQAVLYSTDTYPSIAASLHELAGVLQEQGDLAEARRHLERALEIQDVVYGTETHPDVAASLHALAGVLRAQWDLAGARWRLERVLEIQDVVYGTETHPNVAVSLQELAGVLQEQGDLAEAHRLLRRSLEIQEGLFGTEVHPEVAVSLHTLAKVLRAQGDLAGARRRLERSLEIKAVVYGTEAHPDVATSLHHLASLLKDEGQREEAVKTYQRVIEIRHMIYGTQDHYKTAETEIQLALLLLELARSEEAMPLLQHAVGVLQQHVPNHPLLPQLREMFISAESSAPDSAEEVTIDLSALVQSVIMARRASRHLTDDETAMLKTLAAAGAPHDRVADFLARLVSEPIPPAVPVDLPEEIVQFLRQVREHALGDVTVHEE